MSFSGNGFGAVEGAHGIDAIVDRDYFFGRCQIVIEADFAGVATDYDDEIGIFHRGFFDFVNPTS